MYCPLGHQWVVSKTETAKLREQLEREQRLSTSRLARLDQERADHEATQRRLSATKGVLTKTKKRVAGGACPCCNRTFQNVARHMSTQHPDYVERDTPEATSAAKSPLL